MTHRPSFQSVFFLRPGPGTTPKNGTQRLFEERPALGKWGRKLWVKHLVLLNIIYIYNWKTRKKENTFGLSWVFGGSLGTYFLLFPGFWSKSRKMGTCTSKLLLNGPIDKGKHLKITNQCAIDVHDYVFFLPYWWNKFHNLKHWIVIKDVPNPENPFLCARQLFFFFTWDMPGASCRNKTNCWKDASQQLQRLCKVAVEYDVDLLCKYVQTTKWCGFLVGSVVLFIPFALFLPFGSMTSTGMPLPLAWCLARGSSLYLCRLLHQLKMKAKPWASGHICMQMRLTN